jgi:GTP cyclohydrolase I
VYRSQPRGAELLATVSEIDVGGSPALHDVARHERPDAEGRLDRVGMTEIELPLRLRGPGGVPMAVPARVDAFVSLDDARAKGIHMSRLFLLLQETLEKHELEAAMLQTLLRGFVASHHELSRSAFVELRFDYMIRRRALLSDHSGWRSYPTRVSAGLEGDAFHVEVATRITYSSTCPCSAALARQHVQERFVAAFGHDAVVSTRQVSHWLGRGEGIAATPHSQRSHADVRVRLGPGAVLGIEALIDRVESALATPVQAAVKREDEQEFARLNGQNPMFCEDAARRIQAALRADRELRAWEVRVEHQESLHPHNAVSRVSAGL